jgi:hypothetical protein
MPKLHPSVKARRLIAIAVVMALVWAGYAWFVVNDQSTIGLAHSTVIGWATFLAAVIVYWLASTAIGVLWSGAINPRDGIFLPKQKSK